MKRSLKKIATVVLVLSLMVVGVFVNSHFDIVGEFSDRLSPKNANDLGRGEFSLRPKTDSLFDEDDEDSQVMSMLV